MNLAADNTLIRSTLISSRPQVLGALMRYFCDLDIEEQASRRFRSGDRAFENGF